MNHAPADFIRAGYELETAPTKRAAELVRRRIRAMLEREPDETEPRRLIQQGREDARRG
jgi:hypothetical protein